MKSRVKLLAPLADITIISKPPLSDSRCMASTTEYSFLSTYLNVVWAGSACFFCNSTKRLCRCFFVFSSAFSRSMRSEEHTSELQSRENLVCRLLLEKKKDIHF